MFTYSNGFMFDGFNPDIQYARNKRAVGRGDKKPIFKCPAVTVHCNKFNSKFNGVSRRSNSFVKFGHGFEFNDNSWDYGLLCSGV